MSPRGLGFASLQVLRAVADGHTYGFDVIDRTGLPSGTVYPALASLERRGLVRSRWESRDEAEAEGRPRRRYYGITPPGTAALDAAARRMGGTAPPAPEGANPA